ncbi:hypothetical protein GDO81_008210 [Engystomops pustulosus]|nr:hypothetical protein GDO81_008210 [Engystomops pustulosus]
MFRVKAFAGSEMIGYEKAEFYLIDDGIIGPPTLNASANGKFIDVDIWYPDAPHIDGKNNVGDYLEELTYYLHYGSKTMEMDECDLLGCSVRILITNQTRYCFSAEGKLDQVPMTMEKSEEICINITATKGPPNRSTAIYISLLVVAIFIILIFVVIIKRKMDHKPGLPSPLINIAKNKRSPMHLVSEQGTKYERCSIESPKEQMTPEEGDMDLKGSGIQESTDPKYQGSLGESEQMANEDQNVNEESSDSKNYYHTENSNSTTVCLTEDDDANKQEPVRDLKPVTNSYGYDKPHCPL